jgi:hypothetical protein
MAAEVLENTEVQNASEVPNAGAIEPPKKSERVQIFVVHYTPNIVDGGFSKKISVKKKAWRKPFGSTVIEPFLKVLNATLPESEQLTLDSFEKVLAGPGTRQSDAVPDLSVTVRSVIPEDLHHEDEPEFIEGALKPQIPLSIRVDLMPRKPRDIKVVYENLEVDHTIDASLVHHKVKDLFLPQFLRRINATIRKYCKDRELEDDGIELNMYDVEKVTSFEDEILDLEKSAADTLPRAGRTKLTITLAETAAKWAAAKLPQPERPDKPKTHQVFRVRCQGIELKLTLPVKSLGKPLREAVIVPFLKAYNKKFETKAAAGEYKDVTVDDVVDVKVENVKVSDALLASSFTTCASPVLLSQTMPRLMQ